MGLFGKKKCCCNDGIIKAAEEHNANAAGIKILGSGCTKCRQLEKNAVEALKQLGMDTNIEHVTDFMQIAAYGVMTTPALVADGKVISFGKVLSADEIAELLQKQGG